MIGVSYRFAVEGHRAFRDQALQSCTAEVGDRRGEKAVETPAGVTAVGLGFA